MTDVVGVYFCGRVYSWEGSDTSWAAERLLQHIFSCTYLRKWVKHGDNSAVLKAFAEMATIAPQSLYNGHPLRS